MVEVFVKLWSVHVGQLFGLILVTHANTVFLLNRALTTSAHLCHCIQCGLALMSAEAIHFALVLLNMFENAVVADASCNRSAVSLETIGVAESSKWILLSFRKERTQYFSVPRPWGRLCFRLIATAIAI